MEETARTFSHPAAMAEPDGPRQHHHIGGGKEGNCQRLHQRLVCSFVSLRQGFRQIRHRVIAEPLDAAHDGVGRGSRPAPFDLEPPGREIEPGTGHPIHLGKAPLDACHAGAAMGARDQQ